MDRARAREAPFGMGISSLGHVGMKFGLVLFMYLSAVLHVECPCLCASSSSSCLLLFEDVAQGGGLSSTSVFGCSSCLCCCCCFGGCFSFWTPCEVLCCFLTCFSGCNVPPLVASAAACPASRNFNSAAPLLAAAFQETAHHHLLWESANFSCLLLLSTPPTGTFSDAATGHYCCYSC